MFMFAWTHIWYSYMCVYKKVIKEINKTLVLIKKEQ